MCRFYSFGECKVSYRCLNLPTFFFASYGKYRSTKKRTLMRQQEIHNFVFEVYPSFIQNLCNLITRFILHHNKSHKTDTTSRSGLASPTLESDSLICFVGLMLIILLYIAVNYCLLFLLFFFTVMCF